MKIVVTGATGFIGSNLLAVLLRESEQHTIFAVTRMIPKEAPTGIHWMEADLSCADWTKKMPDEEFDIIIHLAQSQHYRDFPARALDIFNVNVKATIELAEWALKHRVKRYFFASTGSVYGSNDCIHREEDHCEPDTMYGASKLSAEILLKPFSQFMDVIALRLFGVYGPGQTNAMLPGVIQKFNAGDEIILAGNVGVMFNPIYVDDCSAIIHRLITVPVSRGYELLNIGGSEVVDLRNVILLLEKLIGKKALTRTTSEHPKQLVGSTDKLNQLVGFKESVPFEEGLLRTFNFSRLAVEGQQ